MKKCFLILGLICAFVHTNAQINLVRNPSFEVFTKCPTTVNMIKSAVFWQPIDSLYGDTDIPAALCTPEYCNTCEPSDSSEVGVPQGFWYDHYPRTGNGMVMMETYFDNTYVEDYQRDYVQGHLYKSLASGKQYCVTFYVTLCQFSQYANNHLGAYLDNGSMDAGQDSAGCASPQTAFHPQIVEDSIINDTLNWVKVQGTFTANGTETFITIGNFFDIHHTDTISLNHDYPPWNTSNTFAWYLLDDVSVIALDDTANAGPDQNIPFGSTDSVQVGDTTGYLPCYWYKNGVLIDSNKAGFKVFPDTTSSYVMQLDVCGHITTDTVIVHVGRVGIGNLNPDFIRLYPNPVKDKIMIENAFGCTLSIKNLFGKVVLQTEVISGKQIVDMAALPNGVYYGEITEKATGERTVRKIIKE